MTTKEIAVRKKTIRDLLESPAMRKRIQEAIPKHLTPERLIRTVMAAVFANPKLMECTQESLLTSVMGCAQLGLAPEPFLGQAYIVPYKNGKTGYLEAKLIPGYRGYITLARRSGELRSVSTQVVYTKDHFEHRYGTDENLLHIPADGDRGEPKGAYVVFHYKDGGYSFDYMTVNDIDIVRDKFSKSAGKGPWVENTDEMRKKTVIRRHVKVAPLSIEDIPRAAAIEERDYTGESQFDVVFPEGEKAIEAKAEPVADFDMLVTEKLGAYPVEERASLKVKIGEAIQASADSLEISVEECKEQAAVDFETNFWTSFQNWMRQQKPEDPDQKIIAEFSELKTPGLRKWEEKHRGNLMNFSPVVRKAFYEKWSKVIGADYDGDSPASPTIPAEGEKFSTEGHTKSQGGNLEAMVDCPDHPDEQYTKAYCQKRECFSQCPAWEESSYE